MKKGFILVETIIVITILATSLLLIYSSFNSLLVNEKRRMYFDDPVYLYRTYYILDFFQTNNVFNYVDDVLGENVVSNENLLVEVSCNNAEIFVPGSTTKAFCEKLIATKYLEVEHIYFTHYDLGPLTECTDEDDETCQRHPSLRSLTPNAVSYLRTLGSTPGDGYRIVIEFVKEEKLKKKYFYASLVVPLGGNTQ